MAKKIFLIFACLLMCACHEKQKEKKFDVTIDWVPSAEYYGFYYAKENGFYKDKGLDVNIHNGTGAPSVASQLAAETIYAGTTTSDNILIQTGRGANYTKAEPLLKFNPCVIISNIKLDSLINLANKTLGVNKQASVYQQLLFIMKQEKLKNDLFKEYPIGYGGAEQFKNGLVDAILGYTTNVAVDIQMSGVQFAELHLDQLGAKSYGLVLVIGSDKLISKNGINNQNVSDFINATLRGYKEGFKDIPGSVKALKNVDSTLNPEKLSLAIKKIGELNATSGCKPEELDLWVDDSLVTPDVRNKVNRLYN